MAKGYLLFVLHAHLPYVRHPEYDRFLEERWFFEAVTETYIPLIKFFDRLHADRVPFKLTLSVAASYITIEPLTWYKIRLIQNSSNHLVISRFISSDGNLTDFETLVFDDFEF